MIHLELLLMVQQVFEDLVLWLKNLISGNLLREDNIHRLLCEQLPK